MYVFADNNLTTLCCDEPKAAGLGLSVRIPTGHNNPLWRQFQSSLVGAFVRRQRREALRTRLIERSVARLNKEDE